MSTLDTIDQETAVTSIADGDEFGIYQASSGRTKKVTWASIDTSKGGIVNTTATTLTVTQAAHGNRIVTVSSAAPIAITLPQATGTGTKYRFVIMTAATATQHTIKVANSTDVMQGLVISLTTTAGTIIGFATSATSDTVTLNGTTTTGIAGDTWEITDVKTGFFEVNGRSLSVSTTTTPFSATV